MNTNNITINTIIKIGDYIECEGKISQVIKILDEDKYPYLTKSGIRFSRSISVKVFPDYEGFVNELEEYVKKGFPVDRELIKELALQYKTPTWW